MVNPVNRELRELRMLKEKYMLILEQNDNVSDEEHLLTEDDITKINLKVKTISEKIDELLKSDNDYIEVI